MIELTQDNLQEIISENEQVAVQFGAGWCGSCRLIKPKFKRFAMENTSVKFVYVDAEKFPESRALAEVKNLPTFAGYKNGELVYQQFGNKVDIITQLLDEVTNN
jgi:thiol-disulfide isomerase/thioredoxin